MTDLKIVLKAPLAPIYTNFEGGARAVKTRFFGRHFPKKKPRRLFWLFSKIRLRRRKFVQIRVFIMVEDMGRAQKINLVDLKKRSTKFSTFF